MPHRHPLVLAAPAGAQLDPAVLAPILGIELARLGGSLVGWREGEVAWAWRSSWLTVALSAVAGCEA